MRAALVNPRWAFEGSIYFGCREPHLPIEFGYAGELLERAGHEALIVDCHMENLSPGRLARTVEKFRPDFTVITTAPTYLFWRCAPPELRVPLKALKAIRGKAGALILAGPHGSTTPYATLKKTGADYVIRGEFEDVLPRLAALPRSQWETLPCVYRRGREKKGGTTNETDMALLPPIRWPDRFILGHTHHHHRFHDRPAGPSAEIESSRGCPYSCSFCARDNFRRRYRRRPLKTLLAELDSMIAQGARYFYFIDEIFLPHDDLLNALSKRKILFGVQTRIDLWSAASLEALGRAGCVSIEAGVESISDEGRSGFNKRSPLKRELLEDTLFEAKKHVPFVQATLLGCPVDSSTEVARWREWVLSRGVWANEPVPVFPYPGSEEYRKLWGEPDDFAWERAHSHYLKSNDKYSDIQENSPRPLPELERGTADAR